MFGSFHCPGRGLATFKGMVSLDFRTHSWKSPFFVRNQGQTCLQNGGGFCQQICSRWWFQIFFVFTSIWGRFPIWLIFFKGVETTNQCFKRAFFVHRCQAHNLLRIIESTWVESLGFFWSKSPGFRPSYAMVFPPIRCVMVFWIKLNTKGWHWGDLVRWVTGDKIDVSHLKCYVGAVCTSQFTWLLACLLACFT